ncbi:MAG: fimbria/pilus periplasmic chaperone [Gammaproteobacteria bacterium]|nr:fimbria/pilus periplasmic chaperone [Gammaproteobacteria bacterium]
MTSVSRIFFAAFLVLLSFQSFANLLISPTRVVIDTNEKTMQVALVNDSDRPQTYRLEFENKTVNEYGAFTKLDDKSVVGFNRADTMLRVSPRQVSLQPREKQIIKLSLRRPRGLAAEEFRSYLKFVAIPPPVMLAAPDQAQATQLRMLMSFSIPVVVKNGAPKSEVKITSLSKDAMAKEQPFIVTLERAGSSSVFGNLKLYTQPDINNGKPVALLNEAAFYTDTTRRTFKLISMPDTKLSPNGLYKLVIEGVDKEKGIVLASREISLK